MQKYIGDRAFYRRLFSVMLPILIQSVITNFVNLLDNVMVGQVGTEPMSGVAIVNQLLFVFNLCIFGGLAGAGIFTAQYYGAGDDKGVADSFRAKLYIAFGAVLCFAAIFLTAGETLIAQGRRSSPSSSTRGMRPWISPPPCATRKTISRSCWCSCRPSRCRWPTPAPCARPARPCCP